ncbi:MAG: tetratricopeptide repeat protein [Roseococcus sp.]|nr:tetratricopeptide repeat protein [Roseococcus sp.]
MTRWLRWIAALAFPCLPVLIAATLDSSPPRAREAQRAGFVGSDTCAQCHAPQHADWMQSDHARAMAAATPTNVLGDFSGAEAREGQHAASFHRRADGFAVRLREADGSTTEMPVSETFGLDPLQQYLLLMPDGRRQALPWAWDSRPREAGGQRWYHLMPQERLRPGDALHWTGRDQNWNFMCASCHSTGLVRGYDPARDRYETTWTEISVGCESCHGRGAAHVDWARGGRQGPNGLEVALRDASGGAWRFVEGDARGIARWEGPPRQATAAGTETCAACHGRARPLVADPVPGPRLLDTHAMLLLERGEYHADGQIQGEVFEWGSFAQSSMQRAGVVCADCHQPHTGRLRAEGNAVCTQCHLPARFEAASHHRHAPGGEGAQCAACHMPAVTYMGVDRRRDHAFSIPRPDVSRIVGSPDTCTSCHTGQSQDWAAAQLAEWHGPPRGPAHPGLTIHAGRQGAPGADQALSNLALDRSQAAIWRATALSLLPNRATRPVGEAVGGTLRDPEPLVRAAALRALDNLPPANRIHAVRLLSDEVRLVRIEAARALAAVPPTAIPAAARPAFEAAWAELIISERAAAERPEAHVNIAGLLASRGDLAGAEAAYREALARDRDFLPALVNLAGFEEGRGRLEPAQALLRQAVAAHPEAADARYALALFEIRRGRVTEALEPLAAAVRLAPQEPSHRLTQALALQRLGRIAEARSVLALQIVQHPRHRDSLMVLAALLRDQGDLREAERLATAAAALNPADREAAALRDQLRAPRR